MVRAHQIQAELDRIERLLNQRDRDITFRYGRNTAGSETFNVIYDGDTLPVAIEKLMSRPDSSVSSLRIEGPIWMKIVIHPR